MSTPCGKDARFARSSAQRPGRAPATRISASPSTPGPRRRSVSPVPVGDLEHDRGRAVGVLRRILREALEAGSAAGSAPRRRTRRPGLWRVGSRSGNAVSPRPRAGAPPGRARRTSRSPRGRAGRRSSPAPALPAVPAATCRAAPPARDGSSPPAAPGSSVGRPAPRCRARPRRRSASLGAPRQGEELDRRRRRFPGRLARAAACAAASGSTRAGRRSRPAAVCSSASKRATSTAFALSRPCT